jgi:heavy metal translocating P-type ATPase
LLIAANAMTLSLAVSSSEITDGDWRRLQWVLLGLAVASMVVLGWPLARNAARAFARRRITIEAIFLTGIIGAMAGSIQSMATGLGESYFEIVTVLLVVYLFGQQLTGQVQEKAVRAAIDWAPGLDSCLVASAGGGVERVPIEKVRPGWKVVVPPGSMIAVDGRVESGEAFVRESEMTGEPFVVAKRPGDPVWAGTHCVDAKLTVTATTAGRARRIDQILEAVDRARTMPSSIQAQADRLVAWFLPAVIAAAAATFGFWSLVDGSMVALLNAMAVLLVACPCALGLATPLVQWAAIARLAGRGMVVRNADSIEALAAVRRVVFDKTGTLTDPSIRLVDMAVKPPPGMEKRGLLSLIDAVESVAQHPVSKAFAGLAGGGKGWSVAAMTVLPAAGVKAEVSGPGGFSGEVTIGAADRLGVDDSAAWRELRNQLSGPAGSREVAVTVEGEVVAAALVDERLRSSWPDALAALRARHRPSVVLTGDSRERAVVTGADDVESQLGPEEKLARVEELRRRGEIVLFVGDGVNDAAAMAAADLSIAVATGADLASEVADIVWFGEDLRSIPWALDVGERSVRTVRGNLLLAAGYNTAGIALAAAGLLHPVAAALLMTCSSLLVTWRALRGLETETSEPHHHPVSAAMRSPAESM